MSIEQEKMISLLNTAPEKKYLSVDDLKRQRKINYTQITKDNVRSQPRHNLEAIDEALSNEVSISTLRLRKKTTPQGQKPYTNNELKDFLRTFGLKITGNKTVLIERIEDKLNEIKRAQGYDSDSATDSFESESIEYD